jgi:retron-type reverse transcriptase
MLRIKRFYLKTNFRSGHSTTQAVTLIIDKIQKAIENKCYSCGVFLDLSKAFETVNHHILTQKLECYMVFVE